VSRSPAPAASGEVGVRDYETLRAQALARAAAPGDSALGLLLLLGQGIPAWMSRRSLSTDRPMPAPTGPAQQLDQHHGELVRVLADMILATAQQGHP
jgi:hypothetical protein